MVRWTKIGSQPIMVAVMAENMSENPWKHLFQAVQKLVKHLLPAGTLWDTVTRLEWE